MWGNGKKLNGDNVFASLTSPHSCFDTRTIICFGSIYQDWESCFSPHTPQSYGREWTRGGQWDYLIPQKECLLRQHVTQAGPITSLPPVTAMYVWTRVLCLSLEILSPKELPKKKPCDQPERSKASELALSGIFNDMSEQVPFFLLF